MKKCLIVSTVSRQFTLFEKGNIETLKKLGYEIHCAANYEDKTDELKELPITKHHIDIQRSPFSLKNIKAYKQLKQIVNSEKYELIHCHSPMGGVLTRLAARKIRKNNHTIVIYTAHGFHFFKGAPLINWILYYPVEKWLSKYTDCIITLNKEDYNIANRKFKANKVELVNGIGIDENKFNFEMSAEEKHIFKEKLELNDDDFVLIQVGELNKNKNQMMAINTMAKLVKENPKIHLLLVGKGPQEDFYKNKINKYKLEKNVHMLGYRKDIPQLLKISDILLSLSYREGLPVNVMEGMASNLPIIVTDCRGNRDLIKNDENGYVIKFNDILALKEKIIFLLENKNISDKFKRKSKRIIKCYNTETVKKKMLCIYHKN